jgi:hypothetical protein
MAWLLLLFIDVIGRDRLGGVRVNLLKYDGDESTCERRTEDDPQPR